MAFQNSAYTDHYHLSHQFIRVAFDSCYGANKVGKLVKNLGFEALNIGLKTNRLKTRAQTFSAIASEVVELTKVFEKHTELYLKETSSFVETLLEYLKKARRFRYYSDIEKQLFIQVKQDTVSAAEFQKFQKFVDSFHKDLSKDKKNIFSIYFKLNHICQQLLSLVSSEHYAVNLATIEVSRDDEQVESILPSLRMILELIHSIHQEVDKMTESLDRMGALF